MRTVVKPLAAAVVGLSALTLLASAAAAKCTRLAFEVNDYGKDGPTRDAKSLLDKYIATWTAERGIKGYRTGKKDVSCKLFIDLIVFDEYTCKAEATVCWGEGGAAPKSGSASAPAAAKPAAASAKPAPSAATPAAAASKPPVPAATGSVTPASAKN